MRRTAKRGETLSTQCSKSRRGSLSASASTLQDPSRFRHSPPIETFSSWLATFQMRVLVWSGMLGSLLISSSIEIAYAARTVSDSSRLSNRVFASSAARRMFLGTESSPTMRERISMLCFKIPSLSDIESPCVQCGRYARQAFVHTLLMIRTIYNVLLVGPFWTRNNR